MWFWIKVTEVIILNTFAVYFDIKRFKIKNDIVLTGIIFGLATNTLSCGIDGMVDSVIGIIIPIAALFLLFALKMLGAGDIKLFAAIGSIMGWKFIVYTVIVSILFGGFLAVIIVMLRRNAVERFKYLFNYLKLCIITLKIHEYQEMNKNDNGQFRFSYAIAGGTMITLFIYNRFPLF